MARKKRKKLKSVQISTEELVPTTIGYLNSRQKGSFLLIFIFAILFATLYYMPQITNYINKIFNPQVYIDSQDPVNIVEDSTGVIEEFTSDLVLNVSGYKFSNFVINDNEIEYSIDTSLSNGELNNYYFETYDRSKKLLERVLISSTSVTKLSINFNNVKFISINHYDIGKYPSIILKDSKLTCINGEETYEYIFQTGGLTNVNYNYQMNRTDDNSVLYDEMLSKFEAEAGSYLEGISSSLSQTDVSFSYTKEEDLLVLTTSSTEYGYAYQTKSDKIAFEMSTEGYKCN